MRYRYFLPLLLSLIALLAFGGLAADVSGAEIAPAAGQPEQVEKHEGVPLNAAPIFTIGPFTVTN
jgi:hypothetical protein